MANAKANKADEVEPFTYVRDLVERLSAKQPTTLSDFLPHIWFKPHPNARRLRWSG
jgi:hypothetical protein